MRGLRCKRGAKGWLNVRRMDGGMEGRREGKQQRLQQALNGRKKAMAGWLAGWLAITGLRDTVGVTQASGEFSAGALRAALRPTLSECSLNCLGHAIWRRWRWPSERENERTSERTSEWRSRSRHRAAPACLSLAAYGGSGEMASSSSTEQKKRTRRSFECQALWLNKLT